MGLLNLLYQEHRVLHGQIEEMQYVLHTPLMWAIHHGDKYTVETLLKPENKSMLTGILTYHVVAGKLDSKALAKMIKAGGGKAELTTVAGGKLWVYMKGASIIVKDEKGGEAKVTTKDVYQSNGVIHVTDHISMPK